MTKQNLKTTLQTIIQEAFSNKTPILVWYDNGGTLEPLLDQITPKNIQLIKYQGSYLAIRAQIEKEKNFQKQRLIYIPENPPKPSWLRDYEIFGKRLNLDLPTLLTQYFQLSLDRNLKAILHPQNCKHLTARWNEIIGETEIPLTPKQIKQALLAIAFEQPHKFDIKKAILTYLKHHETLTEKLQKTNLTKTFLEILQDEYGYKPSINEQTPNPKRLAATILLTELVVNSQGIAEKELSDILPPKHKRKFWASLATEWAANENYQDSFIQWSQQLETEYDIPTKIKGRPNIENITSFKTVDETLLEEIITRINNEGLTGIRKNTTFIKNIIKKRKNKIWTRSGLFIEWKPIEIALELLQKIQESLTTLEKTINPESILQHYTQENGWWQIDQLYRDLTTYETQTNPKIRKLFINIPREQYQEWLRKLGNIFSLTIEKLGKWQIKNITNQQNFWQNFVHPHKEKVAIFFLDAFRYELQKRLAKELQKEGIEVKQTPMLASIPSITEIAMAALLPHQKMSVQVSKGDIKITLDGKTVLTKAERINFLKEKFEGKIAFLEIKDLQKNVVELKKRIENAQILVIMDREIDKAGSFITEDLINYFDQLLICIKKAVETSAKLGYEKIILTTDHGFLLMPLPHKTDILESIPSSPETFIGKRFAIGKPPQTQGAISLSNENLEYLPENTWAIFPIGISQFPRPGPKEQFIHGGISPQECFIGILECTPKKKMKGQKVRIKVSLPSIISSAIFIVSIKPIIQQISDLPRTVIIELLEQDRIILRSEPTQVYDKEESLTLKLPRIPKEIEVKIKDYETEEVLFRKTMKVSLEGYDELL